ncbi:S1 family peptidase [Rugamonas apoptosis]|uniref:Trypsin-like peptidase domain-containing protein n=1 Tax=Rugamonas apoptosis TaxID=2758570 RepID=A0A7W2F8W8_9BURK|nr:serine protease [Rugamonas apoptosis]MBA5687263.1 trypsin-like peptidase domain-containing protein [Rugamonas apoptosis]
MKLWPWVVMALAGPASTGAELEQVIEHAKPSIVGIGSYQKLRTPPLTFVGTGFVIGDGLTVVTAAHVLQDLRNADASQVLGVLVGQGDGAQFRAASISALDQEHDLAQLHMAGTPLPAMRLGDSSTVAEGRLLAFTGFPLGMVLGLHPVTHRGMVSAITPVATPPVSSGKLDARLASQLHRQAYPIFQLDGTAYPGNSGSPLYDTETGLVYGVINMVYVKGLKEAAIATPSGITYAIPVNYLRGPAPHP